jgi:hypothetical protein
MKVRRVLLTHDLLIYTRKEIRSSIHLYISPLSTRYQIPMRTMSVFNFLVILSFILISSQAKISKRSPHRRVERYLKNKSAKALDYHSITIEEIKASKKQGSGKGGKNKNWKGDGYGKEPPNPLGKGKSPKSSKSSKCKSDSGKSKGGNINCDTASPTVTSTPSSKPSESLSPSIAPTTSSAPTSFPTLEFDFQVCRTFSQIW